MRGLALLPSETDQISKGDNDIDKEGIAYLFRTSLQKVFWDFDASSIIFSHFCSSLSMHIFTPLFQKCHYFRLSLKSSHFQSNRSSYDRIRLLSSVVLIGIAIQCLELSFKDFLIGWDWVKQKMNVKWEPVMRTIGKLRIIWNVKCLNVQN